MERINFMYTFRDDTNEVVEKNVELRLQDKEGEGITASAICTLFEDFMEAAGYSIDNVLNYFRE